MSGRQPKRKTAQRQAIMDELFNQLTHPTATELHRAVRKRISNISLGTIYRNLESMVKGGLARKIDMGKGEARFDAILTPHCHVKCSSCGRLPNHAS